MHVKILTYIGKNVFSLEHFGGVDERFLAGKPIILSFGAARSGKSTLAAIGSSMKDVDHIDEPFELIYGFANQYLGLQSSALSEASLAAFVSEMKCESLLLRRANFRPNDGSSIWRTKQLREITNRLLRLKTRADAIDYMHKNRFRLWITCTDLLPLRETFLSSAIQSQSLLVIRDPLEVSCAIKEKGWFSDSSLKNPTFNTPVTRWIDTKSGDAFFMPWWLKPAYFEEFFLADEHGRGLIYWDSIYSTEVNSAGAFTSKDTFSFQQIFKDSTVVVDRLAHLLERTPTRKTFKLIKSLNIETPKSQNVSSASSNLYDSLVEKYSPHFKD